MPTPLLRTDLACPDEWRSSLAAALSAAGVQTSTRAAVGLAVSHGRTPLEQADRWSVDSRPHLLVDLRAQHVEVGPWVLPGVGPCARCVEAATFDVGDPGSLPTLDQALVAIAAGWVARELRTWLRCETPSTWGASWRITHDPEPRTHRWERHPYCGCAWFDTAVAGA